MRNSRLEILRRITAFLLIFFIVGSVPGLSGCSSKKAGNSGAAASVSAQTDMASFAYDGKPYVVINDNDPDFTDADMTTTSFERYGELDGLGRCTTAFANIGKDLMPAEKRGPIGEVKPTGWQTAKYDNVDGKYLYNRCHLIGYQLTGENANEKNLITGTRYLNVDGMLPFENMVADYIKETNNHVLYRVTPVFSGDNLVASGVQMEAESVEDNGDGILFNVYCFNAQPGIAIDYATGDSHKDDSIVADASKSTTAAEANVQTYVLNTNTKKFHKESCNSAKSMDASNKRFIQEAGRRLLIWGMRLVVCASRKIVI